MKKSIFKKSIKEIKADQENLTGSFANDHNFPHYIHSLCEALTKAGLVDKYIKDIDSPLGILFIVNITNKHGMTICGDGTNYSFWQTDQKMPIPIASTSEDMFWHPDLYARVKNPPTATSPIAPIVHQYNVGHFIL